MTKSSPPKKKDYITVPEMAEALDITVRGVHKIIERKTHFPGAYKVDPSRPNSPIRVPLNEWEAFLRLQRAQPVGGART